MLWLLSVYVAGMKGSNVRLYLEDECNTETTHKYENKQDNQVHIV